MYGNLQHCNIDLRSGALDHFFSMPDLHRWHHSAVYEEGDPNYGVFTRSGTRSSARCTDPTTARARIELGVGRMPDFPTRFVELVRVPIDWARIRERNAATWNEPDPGRPRARGREATTSG